MRFEACADSQELPPPHTHVAHTVRAQGETSEARFTVTNVCPFHLSFAMRFRGVKDPNLHNKPAFYCRPSEGTLAQVR